VRLLLDTCSFLWLAGGTPLSEAAVTVVRNPANDLYLSAVSTWEISTKYQSGRLPLPESPERLIPIERRLRGKNWRSMRSLPCRCCDSRRFIAIRSIGC
jgi:PIN domain nuclease of toxin-antitoxin system